MGRIIGRKRSHIKHVSGMEGQCFLPRWTSCAGGLLRFCEQRLWNKSRRQREQRRTRKQRRKRQQFRHGKNFCQNFGHLLGHDQQTSAFLLRFECGKGTQLWQLWQLWQLDDELRPSFNQSQYFGHQHHGWRKRKKGRGTVFLLLSHPA